MSTTVRQIESNGFEMIGDHYNPFESSKTASEDEPRARGLKCDRSTPKIKPFHVLELPKRKDHTKFKKISVTGKDGETKLCLIPQLGSEIRVKGIATLNKFSLELRRYSGTFNL